MADRGAKPFSRLANPLKSWTRRFTAVALFILALTLLLIGKADLALVERARALAVDIASPILAAATAGADAVSGGADRLRDLTVVLEENERLKARIAALELEARRSAFLAQENANLRGLLAMRPDGALRQIGGRVIADRGGSFVRSIIVNIGARDGAAIDQAVMSADGYVGRVVEVGRWTSRVLLATDLNSRIPVQIQPDGARAVMTGDNSRAPQLLYIPETARVQAGDPVTTSGHGGVFPPGMPVGEILVDESGERRVRLYDDLLRLNYVRLIDFGIVNTVTAPDAPEDRGDAIAER